MVLLSLLVYIYIRYVSLLCTQSIVTHEQGSVVSVTFIEKKKVNLDLCSPFVTVFFSK